MLSKLVPQGASQTQLHVAPRGFGSCASPPRPCSCAVLESQGGLSLFSDLGAAVGFLGQAGIYPGVHSRLISTFFSYLAGTYFILSSRIGAKIPPGTVPKRVNIVKESFGFSPVERGWCVLSELQEWRFLGGPSFRDAFAVPSSKVNGLGYT